MYAWSGVRRILAHREPVDMRKSFDGLIAIVRHVLGEDPLSGTLFVFVNRNWDRTGFCLFAKRLERGRFAIPGRAHTEELSDQALRLILDGIPLGSRGAMG